MLVSQMSPETFDWGSRPGSLDEVPAIVKLGVATIGETHPSARTLTERLVINPDVLQVFSRRNSRGSLELCGYSLLYPLSDAAGVAISNAQIHSGRELALETLLSAFTDAKYLYVGMLLGARDRAARSHAKVCVRHELARRLDEGKVKSIFARPATPSGRRLLDAYGFLPVAKAEDIWAVSTAQLKRNIT
jgi:hypothetical protein